MQCFINSTNSKWDLLPFVPYWTILSFLGVVGNSAVIIYNIFLNHHKTPSSWLVTNLAVADLLVCLAIYPAKIYDVLHSQQRTDNCYFEATLFASMFLSVMILLTITIDKYLYIAKPLKYPMIVTKRRNFILVSCI